MTQELAPNEFVVDPASTADPNGFLFHYQEGIFRAIRDDAAPFYRRVLSSGMLSSLPHFIAAETSEYSVPSAELVLRHPTVRPVSYAPEWAPSMLRRAARATLELNLELLEFGCTLQDASPWNVLFSSTKPTFVDFTSIVPLEKHHGYLWAPYQQFLDSFLHPLEWMAAGKGKLARALLRETVDGVTLEDLAANLRASDWLGRPLRSLELKLGAWLCRRFLDGPRSRKWLASAMQNTVSDELRADFLRRQLHRVDAFRFSAPKIGEMPGERNADVATKRAHVERMLRELAPRSVLDLGCHDGRYSLLAAELGMDVIAVDKEEGKVERLFLEADRRNLPLVPLVVDVTRPDPTFETRAQSDVVLCLALMHHWHLQGRQGFPKIASTLARLAKHAVIFEYVDLSDENNALLRHRFADYGFEQVRDALAAHFDVEAHPSDRATRTLLLCRKRN